MPEPDDPLPGPTTGEGPARASPATGGAPAVPPAAGLDAQACLRLAHLVLLDALDREDIDHALSQLVTGAHRLLGRPVLIAAQAAPDRAGARYPAPPEAWDTHHATAGSRHATAGSRQFALQRLGQPLGTLTIGQAQDLDAQALTSALDPLIASASTLLQCGVTAAGLTSGGRHAALIRAALVGAGTFVWEWDIDSDVLGDIDQGFEQLGYPRPSRGYTQQDWDALIHPDDRAANDDAYQRHARGETDAYEHAYRARAADGSWRWLEERGRIVEWHADGRPRRMLGTQSDITERRRLEAEASAAMSRLGRIAAHVPGALFQLTRGTDARVEFAYISERCEALTGLSASELRRDAMALLRRVDEPYRERVLASLRESERLQSQWQVEFRLLRLDGQMRWIRCHASARRGDGLNTPAEGGPTTTWHGYLEDVTDARAAEQAQLDKAAAEAANRAKTEFLSSMSHELRTPLNAVLGFAQLLELDRQQPLSDEQRKRVGLIRAAGTHLLAMISDMLDLSRIEAGRLHLDIERVELGALVVDCLDMVRPAALVQRIELAHEGPTPTWLDTDRKRLRQVLLNLLSNAVKYNRPDGRVSVRHRVDGDRVQIEVTDTGLGMTEADCLRLFEPFNRLSQTMGAIEGTGIGLTVTRGLVSLMGGQIRVSSTLGRGSVFTVTLPG